MNGRRGIVKIRPRRAGDIELTENDNGQLVESTLRRDVPFEMIAVVDVAREAVDEFRRLERWLESVTA